MRGGRAVHTATARRRPSRVNWDCSSPCPVPWNAPKARDSGVGAAAAESPAAAGARSSAPTRGGGLERQRTGDGRRRRGVHRGKAVGQRRREPAHEREEIARGAVDPGSMGDLAGCHVDDLGRDVDAIADTLVRALDPCPGIRSRAAGTFRPAALVAGLRRGARSDEATSGSGCRARRRRPAPGPERGCEGLGDALANPVVVAPLARIDERCDGNVERLAARGRRRSRGRCERITALPVGDAPVVVGNGRQRLRPRRPAISLFRRPRRIPASTSSSLAEKIDGVAVDGSSNWTSIDSAAGRMSRARSPSSNCRRRARLTVR